ncbi:hypothetical protein [Streptomyces bullii]|uniref:Uncharacterized protein n=1 Tax=Streptomyces bullii TaxID=349910 RepID=A0ABW0UU29_9ACTN
MPDTYDLEALLWEIRVLAREHGFDGRDASRISALVLDRLGCATASEAYERLYADWRKLPVGTMPSGLRAGQILRILPMLHYDQPVTDLGREDELRRAAREYGPADENWQGLTTAASGWHGMQQITDPADLRAALTRLEEDRSHHPPGSPMRDVVDWQYAGLRAHLAQTTGGEDEFDAAVADLARLTGSPVFDEQTRILMAGQLATLRMHQAVRDGDEALLGEQIQALEDVLAQLPPDHADRLTMQSNLEAATTGLALLRAQRTGSFATAVDGMPAGIPVQEVRRQTAALPRNIRAHQLGEMGHSQVGRALMTQDHQAALDGMRLFEDALELLEPDDDRWLRNAGGLGTAHCALAVLEIAPPHTRAHHLDQGIAWLRHLWRLTAGPHHSLWGVTGLSLARAYRHRGDAQPRRSRARRANHDEARRIGLESLRAASWSVLLQSGTAHAAAAARLAGEQAAEVARWCLADGAHTEAVRALDAGRALALHAATVSATVPDLLTALGQAELADEWRQSGDTATPEPGGEAALLTGGFLSTGRSSRLRHRVLRALAASPLRERLLGRTVPRGDRRSPARAGRLGAGLPAAR